MLGSRWTTKPHWHEVDRLQQDAAYTVAGIEARAAELNHRDALTMQGARFALPPGGGFRVHHHPCRDPLTMYSCGIATEWSTVAEDVDKLIAWACS